MKKKKRECQTILVSLFETDQLKKQQYDNNYDNCITY